MKKVIITGATGMIGISLINELISKNIQVLAIVRENSNRIKNIPKNENIKIIECSLANLKNINIQENDFDVFYHFAWDGTFGDERNNQEKQDKNVEYTLDALKLAKRLGCKRFIGAGSQAEFGRVYGIINENTFSNPETEYGKAKLKAELESRKLAEDLKIKHIWPRIFSCYGPYDGTDTMIMMSIREMLNGNSPKYTLAEQNWDYIFSEDVATIFYLLGEKENIDEKYCIAYGETKKLSEYIENMRDIIDTSIKLKFGEIPYSQNQVMNLKADISKLEKDIGFRPKVRFEEGIRKTIDWYKSINNEV